MVDTSPLAYDPANMHPTIAPEVALWAFFEEHHRRGELDGGVEGEVLWMTCECGARLAKLLKEGVR